MALQRLSSTEAPAFASSVEEDFLVEKGNGYKNHTVKGSIEHSDERYENHKQNDEDESEDDDGDSSCSVEDTYHRNGAKDVEDTSSSLMNDVDHARDRRLSDEISSLSLSLNPLAQEFRPPMITRDKANDNAIMLGDGQKEGKSMNGRKSSRDNDVNRQGQRSKRSKGRTRYPNASSIRRTVYVCDIENSVTEEQLAGLFIRCGQVIDCRICGDPNSTLRFAFVEFTSEDAAVAACSLNGAILNYQQLQVLPSKTSIVPVNPVYLPQSHGELEVCSRTVYVTNIDRAIDRRQLAAFFEHTCGSIAKSRLLGQSHHPTRIAFIEFMRAESAMGALNCSGAVLGNFPIRVSPSKTPVRLRKTERGGRNSRSRSHSSVDSTVEYASRTIS